MYYYVENKKEFIQSNNTRFEQIHIARSQQIGNILSELINLDYNKLSESIINSIKRNSTKNGINVSISAIYQNIDGVCPETEIIVNLLFVMNFHPSSNGKYHQIENINEIINEIKYLVQRDDFNELSPSFVFYYLVNKFNVRIDTSKKFIDSFSHISLAPVLSKYICDDSDVQTMVCSFLLDYHRTKIADRNDLTEKMLNELKKIGMTNCHYEICKKIIAKHPYGANPLTYKLNIAEYGFTKDEAFEYQKLTYEYELGNIYKLNNLSQFIILSFTNCCANNIMITKCEHCGNIYFKHGKKKYCCEGCAKAAKKIYQNNKIYTYTSPTNEEITVSYNNVLRNFEKKVDKVIKYINNDNIEELKHLQHEERESLTKGLERYKFKYREYRNELTKYAEEISDETQKKNFKNEIALLFVEISNIYKEKIH